MLPKKKALIVSINIILTSFNTMIIVTLLAPFLKGCISIDYLIYSNIIFLIYKNTTDISFFEIDLFPKQPKYANYAQP